MGISSLSCGTKEFLQKIAPNEEVKKEISNCIVKYTEPLRDAGFFRRVQYIAFRILNILKAIFGRSEWQMAIKQLVNYDHVDASLKEPLYSVGEKLMRIALELNQVKAHVLSNKVRDLLAMLHGEKPHTEEPIFLSVEEIRALPQCTFACP